MNNTPTPEHIRKRDEWIAKYGQRPEVQAWLRKYPPPANWKESPEAYAYIEMPVGVLFSPRSAIDRL